jgi:glutamine synthetase
MEIGVDTLPKLPKDAGDRNRTSPFAFTGNRFEFRAVGGGQSIAGPLIALQTAIAESLDYIAGKLEASVGSGKTLNASIQAVLTELSNENAPVVFNGNGYSEEWHQEAEKRGLPNLKTTVDALPQLNTPEVIKLFDKYNVLTPRELKSRYEIYLEQYCKTVNVEANLVQTMAQTLVLPAALRYQTELASGATALKAAGMSASTALLEKVVGLSGKLEKAIGTLQSKMAHEGAADVMAEAKHFAKDVLPAMEAVRAVADELEGLVADDLWPLPTYQEMLFIR